MNHALVIANFVQACCWWVDHPPQAGETCSAHRFLSEPGGKGLNVAVALQRLGVNTTPVLAHGNDSAADQLRQLLQQEGLSLAHVHALPMPSGWGAGFIEPNGQNRIAVFAGANAHLSRDHVQLARAVLEKSCFVYAPFEAALDAVEAAMQLAHSAGRPAVLNPSPWQPLTDALRRSVSCYLVNHREAEQLLQIPFSEPATDQDMAHLLAALAPALARFWATHPAAQELVLTLGAWGSVGWQRPETAPHKLTQAVTQTALRVNVQDTVGCGDAFAAGYCWARYARHQSMAQSLTTGNACGAHVASCTGVLDALPTAAQLQALMA